LKIPTKARKRKIKRTMEKRWIKRKKSIRIRTK
jgi:hypothetical protein